MSAQSVVNAKQQQQQQQHSSIATRHCPSRTKDGSPAVSVVLELDELTNLQRHFDAGAPGREVRSRPPEPGEGARQKFNTTRLEGVVLLRNVRDD